jgi:ribonuclease PH
MPNAPETRDILPAGMRPVSIDDDPFARAEGSALIRCGETIVLCAASVSDQVPDHARLKGRGWVTAEYSLLPRSTHTRSPRERHGAQGRTQEIQRLIGRSLRSVTDLERLAGSSIVVDCDVLRADGGTRCAAITGAFVALGRAVRKLRLEGKAQSGVLADFVSAVSVGIVAGERVLDLDYARDRRAEVDMNVVMTGAGRFVEVQGTAEGKPFDDAALGEMIALAKKGCAALAKIQSAALGVDRAVEL